MIRDSLIYNNCTNRIKHVFRILCVKFGVVGKLKGLTHSQKKANNICSEEVIVSLTSYGRRLNTVHLAIRSIMKQSFMPNRVILYLDSSCSEEGLPKQLLKLKKRGLEIRFDCEDLKPHKKYYYAFFDFPNSIVITIDDDVVYARDTLESLIRGHVKFPNSVVARHCYKIHKNSVIQNSQGTWKPYKGDDISSYNLVGTGVGGVLYPVQDFDLNLLDINIIKTYCINADDIYLKYYELLNRIPVTYVNNSLNHPYIIRDTQESALYKKNHKGGNDKVIHELRQIYKDDLSEFQEIILNM